MGRGSSPAGKSPGISGFSKMTSDGQAEFMDNAWKTVTTRPYADDSYTQIMLHALGVNKPPTVVSDEELDKMPGTELFRTVNEGPGITADEILTQVATSDYTYLSGVGGSLYGRGIYFADDAYESALYTDGKTGMMMRAKIKPNAKIGGHADLEKEVYAERNSGSKLGNELKKLPVADAVAIYAMGKGYDILLGKGGYHAVLNREILAVSSTTKSAMVEGSPRLKWTD